MRVKKGDDYVFKTKIAVSKFFKDQKLIAHLVSQGCFDSKDTVIDIGAGSGLISQELAKSGARIVAIELDNDLIPKLKNSLQNFTNVEIINADFRQVQLPKQPYKVFANILFI